MILITFQVIEGHFQLGYGAVAKFAVVPRRSLLYDMD